MDKRILIGCPVHNRELYLPHYLKHIHNINYDKKLIDIYWIVNNSTDATYDILKDFKEKYKDEYNSVTIDVFNNKKYPKDQRNLQTREKIYHWLSDLRNKLLKKCTSLNCDYLFSCDSDILVPSDIITRLLYHKKDFVASLIYNGYLAPPVEIIHNKALGIATKKPINDYNAIENAYKSPNILKATHVSKDERGEFSVVYKHIVNYKVKNPNLNPINTLTEVDFTGAVFLCSQELCTKSFYAWHKQGEDEVFSRVAKMQGYKLYCDLSLYSQHCMSEKILNMYLNGELTYTNGETIKIV